MSVANERQVGGSHYKSKVQHWDFIVANGIPYLEAMAIRYISRWRKKGGHQDLYKAKHFLEKLFETEGIPWDPETANPVPTAEGLQLRGQNTDTGYGKQVFAGSAAEQDAKLQGDYRGYTPKR